MKRLATVLALLAAGCCSLQAYSAPSVSSAPPADSDSSPQAVAAALAGHTVVRGRFVQTRALPEAAITLRSEGEFIFWRQQGIYWSTQQPVQRSYLYREDATLVRDGEDGAAAWREQDRMRDRHFRRILLSIFSFDREQLAQNFEQSWRIGDGRWRLALQPRGSAGRFLSGITLWGDTVGAGVAGLRIDNDETLTLEFSHTSTPQQLDVDACRRYFDLSSARCEQLTRAHTP